MSAAIERVLLALDAAAETRTAIDIAVRLAACARVRLHAVFVEDEDLLNLASLPISREVVPGARAGALTTEDVELHLRAAASRAHQDILTAARSHAVESSFEIVRGVAETALSDASESDLVVTGALARPIAGHFRVASRWLEAVEAAPGPILLARESGRSRRVVVLLRERTGGSALMLHIAARIAELGAKPFTVICAPALATAKDLADWVDEQVAPADVRPQLEAAPGDPAALQTRIAELDCGLLALDVAATERGWLAEVASRLACDVLVGS